LPDVNVMLALASRRHVHHAPAVGWLDTTGEGETSSCRVTQMGLLRLLTNRRALGADVLEMAEAWSVYHRMTADSRIQLLAEPAGIQQAGCNLAAPTGPPFHGRSECQNE
jgi:toxin-antitoxin system PIN domain toxin